MFQAGLSGEGVEQFFGGYAWLPVEYLRQPDLAGLALELDLLTSDAERHAILNHIQMATVRVCLGHQYASCIRRRRDWVYNSAALAITGVPDVLRAISEGLDSRVRAKAVFGAWHPLNVASYVSAKTILLQVILNAMGERIEMAHSVEGRPPFLVHHLVEYINTLPPSLKVKPVRGDDEGKWLFTDKWILR
ncbi:hypothetical protein C8R44DRAFT_886703 [Mycena epipterygia]|nr:hypothetical protein C8R44DRAFT_886703 [Mycena epipterygia]